MKQDNQVSTVEYLHNLQNVFASRAAQGAAYHSWSDKFAREEVLEFWLNKEGARRLSKNDILSVNRTQLWELGFGNWDGKLILIPLWVYNYIADGEILTSISGEEKIKGQDNIDLDVRFGCIASGFKDKET